MRSKQLLDAALEAVNSGRVRFPLSRAHITELGKVANANRRRHLAAVFTALGKGHVIAPLESVIGGELLRFLEGEETLHLPQSQVLREGLLHAFGSYRSQARQLGVTEEEVRAVASESTDPLAVLVGLLGIPNSSRQVFRGARRYAITVESVREGWLNEVATATACARELRSVSSSTSSMSSMTGRIPSSSGRRRSTPAWVPGGWLRMSAKPLSAVTKNLLSV